MPLTFDELLPLDEYASRRKEFFDSHRRYVDRYRRVRIGPRLTLVFENRRTRHLSFGGGLCSSHVLQNSTTVRSISTYQKLFVFSYI